MRCHSPQTVTVALPLAFVDQPTVTIRFRAVGAVEFFLFPEYAVLDDVRLTGTPVATSGCTSDAECSALNGACAIGVCNAGVCEAVPVPVGTACGDPSSSECDAPDRCDGSGTCTPNHAAADTACGDPIASACDAPDSCDGAGACAANFASPGTTCGDPSSTECDAADTCNGAGACQANVASAGAPCGDPSTSVCDGADSCDGSPRARRERPRDEARLRRAGVDPGSHAR